ncbi:MAG: phosphoribosyltransferase [Steroidobacteraceae bacterium]|nr:phosphoribosyltransferase [Steroidobacteraceae bacterium]
MYTDIRFRDRREAGRRLAAEFLSYAGRSDVLVLALPRGGVPVGYEVARALGAPLDVFLVRKLGTPGHEELAMGAVASGGIRVLNDDVVSALGLDKQVIEAAVEHETRILSDRERRYRGDRPATPLADRIVLLVDDGLATGATMRAAIAAVRRQSPKQLIVAVPVAPPETCETLRAEADEIVCLVMPTPFYGVGFWYEDFSPTTDEEVRELLAAGGNPRRSPQANTG